MRLMQCVHLHMRNTHKKYNHIVCGYCVQHNISSLLQFNFVTIEISRAHKKKYNINSNAIWHQAMGALLFAFILSPSPLILNKPTTIYIYWQRNEVKLLNWFYAIISIFQFSCFFFSFSYDNVLQFMMSTHFHFLIELLNTKYVMIKWLWF